jgi:threonine dehydrogenase-like Zn-dependent dehydrogenase
MRVARLYAAHDLRLEEMPRPTPAAGQVLIEVRACSICGSDVHAYQGHHPRLTLPRVLGHEFAGVIAATGPGVTGLPPGTAVCSDIDLSCGRCRPCRAGRGNICVALRTLGFDADGAYAEFVTVPAANIYRLPEGVGFDEGAVVQTLGIGYHAVAHRAEVKPGQRVVILGSGPIGLSILAAAKALGGRVGMTDFDPFRLDLARRMGADATWPAGGDDLVGRVLDWTDGEGADTVFEAVGGDQDATLGVASQVARRGGLLVMVGTFTANRATLRAAEFKDRELELRGSRGNHQAFGPCLDLLAAGKLDPTPMITHRLPLADAEGGLTRLKRREPGMVKVVLRP